MKRSLVIDVGNTHTKLAMFMGEELIGKERWEVLSRDALQDLTYNQCVENVILSSVASVASEVEVFLAGNFYCLTLTAQTPLPITILYTTPHTLGNDRVAAAAGAHHLYPGENCLVIDAGTCITCDVLTERGEFLGGNISPGVGMRLEAMHRFTARLPLVQRADTAGSPPYDILGSSTETAIRNGAQLGASWEIEAFIQTCRQRFPALRVILTGGDTDFFAKTLKTEIFAHPDLVLIGLHQILKYNVEKER